MKKYLILPAIAVIFTGCDARVTPIPAEKTVDKSTTIVNPPANEAPKVENKTVIVNPAPKEEKKVENKTIIVNPPAPAVTEEKKTTTTTTVK
jgi:hypothetical protein